MQKQQAPKGMTVSQAIAYLKSKWENQVMTPAVALHCLKTIDQAAPGLSAVEYYELKKTIFEKVQMQSTQMN